MANTGLLPFVRGVDFTCNDFSVSIGEQSKCICWLIRDDIIPLTYVLLFIIMWPKFFAGWEVSWSYSVHDRAAVAAAWQD